MDKIQKVAIYTRVSTEEQNPKTQEEICLRYCEKMNYQVHKVYTDVYTGTSDKRPSFNKMLEDMRKYEFDIIIITRLDRLTRSLKHLLGLIDEFNAKRIGLIVTEQNIDTQSSSGKMQMQMLGVIAEFERNLISDRTKEALRRKGAKKRGKDTKPRLNKGYFGNRNWLKRNRGVQKSSLNQKESN